MSRLIHDLAECILCGPYNEQAATERSLAAIEFVPSPLLKRISPSRWIRGLIRKVFQRFPEADLPPLKSRLQSFLVSDEGAGNETPIRYGLIQLDLAGQERPRFSPLRQRFRDWGLPELATTGELMKWLEVTPSELDWLAARFHRSSNDRRYDVRILISKSGKRRLIEAPCQALKRTQRQLLDGILSRIPPHEAARGIRAGTNVLAHAQAHCGQAVVWKLDLGNFFLSIPAGRVLGLFRTCGYPERVARVLTGLTTSRISSSQLAPLLPQLDRSSQRELSRLATELHLPQGAPTSPALANLIAWRLDRRLAALAEKFGASYTRYADDMAFSGDRAFRNRLPRFRVWTLAIIADEGFLIRSRKSRIMTSGGRQEVTGVVVNQKPNLARKEYKQLHAILHNSRMQGWESQNREGHPNFLDQLRGRIAWVTQLNPARGEKLREMLENVTVQGRPAS